MSYEEEIKDLKERVQRLEKIEKRRKIFKAIKIGFKLLIIVIIFILAFKLYKYVLTYKEKLDKLQNISDTIDASGDYLKDNFGFLDGLLKK